MFLLLGIYLLLLSILTAFFSIIVYFLFKRVKLLDKWVICHFILLTLSMISLLFSYIDSDFSVFSIIMNSSSLQPIFYKFSALWGNHEGSMLLWCWILSFITYTGTFWRKMYKDIWNIFFLIQLVLSLLFESYTFFLSNPYQLIEFRVLDGVELLPVLQDPILLIHPPIIYIGYLLLSVPFSLFFCWYYWIRKDLRQSFLSQWYRYCWKYTLLSTMFLTFGISLGSWWAYYELGWGGWWFWDPVENASLLPWICNIILIHSLLGFYSNRYLRYLGLHFSFFSFFFVLLGTFSVRSGILESVHSFASDFFRGTFFLILILFLIILYLLSLRSIFFQPVLKENSLSLSNTSVYKSPNILFFQIFYFLLFLFTICIGMFYPLLRKLLVLFSVYLFDITVGSEFYNNFISLFLWSFLFFLALGSNSKKISCIVRGLLFSISILSIAFFFQLSNLNLKESIDFLFIILVIYVLVENRTLGTASFSVFFAHLSISLFIFFVKLWSKYSFEIHELVSIGDRYLINSDISLILRGYNVFRGPNYESVYGNFLLLDDHKYLGFLFPEKRHYFNQDFYSSKVDIVSNFIYDIQIVFGDGNFYNGWSINLYYYPYMTFIWISCLMLTLSFLYSFYRKFK